MKQDYTESDFGPDDVVVGNDFISTYPSKEDLLNLKQNVELLANDTGKDLNALQSELHYISAEIYGNKAIAGEQIEKLQKELQEFKKDTNKFLKHLIDTSITLSVAIVFILILISFYYK
jgi:archaellum biogenesis protein FlaJ (TadC family)